MGDVQPLPQLESQLEITVGREGDEGEAGAEGGSYDLKVFGATPIFYIEGNFNRITNLTFTLLPPPHLAQDALVNFFCPMSTDGFISGAEVNGNVGRLWGPFSTISYLAPSSEVKLRVIQDFVQLEGSEVKKPATSSSLKQAESVLEFEVDENLEGPLKVQHETNTRYCCISGKFRKEFKLKLIVESTGILETLGRECESSRIQLKVPQGISKKEVNGNTVKFKGPFFALMCLTLQRIQREGPEQGAIAGPNKDSEGQAKEHTVDDLVNLITKGAGKITN